MMTGTESTLNQHSSCKRVPGMKYFRFLAEDCISLVKLLELDDATIMPLPDCDYSGLCQGKPGALWPHTKCSEVL